MHAAKVRAAFAEARRRRMPTYPYSAEVPVQWTALRRVLVDGVEVWTNTQPAEREKLLRW
jgi:hypothetical protein